MCIIDFTKTLQRQDFPKESTHVRLLLEAITGVEPSFIVYEDRIFDPDPEEERVHLERVFAYELYRVWVNLLKEKGYKNALVNGELSKNIKTRISYKMRKSDAQGGEERTISPRVFPDFILHHSQGDGANQKIACEIKRAGSGRQAIFADLLKLSCLLDGEYFAFPFEHAVFVYICKGDIEPINLGNPQILLGGMPITFEEYINSEEFSPNFRKIICIAYNGKDLKYSTLAEALGR